MMIKIFNKEAVMKAIMALVVFVLLVIIIDPYRNSKEPLSSDDYEITLTSETKYAHIKPLLIFKSDYFITNQKGKEKVEFKLNFKNDIFLTISSGVLPWSKTKDSALVSFEVLLNSKHLAYFECDSEKNANKKVRINSGDQLDFIVSNPLGVDFLEGSVSIQKINFLSIFYLLILSAFLAISLILVVNKNTYRMIIFPLLVGLVFIKSGVYNDGVLNRNEVFTYFFLVFSFLLSNLLIYHVKKKTIYWILSSLNYLIFISVSIIPLSFLSFLFVFDKPISEAEILTVFQSNASESIQYMNLYMPTVFYLFFIAIIGLLIMAMWPPKTVLKSSKKLKILYAILLFSFGMYLGKNLLTSGVYTFYYEALVKYEFEIQEFKKVLAQYNQGKVKIEAIKEEKGETYLIVIGESLGKRHMSLYGYHRETNPYLSELNRNEELIVFNEANACHTHTMPVLEMALTSANQMNRLKGAEGVPLIPILNEAGFQTYWISNQIKYSAWDNVVTVLSESCDKQVFINKKIGTLVKTKDYDERLIVEVEKALNDNTEENKVVFVHLMGSHGDYYERYPPRFDRFSGSFSKGEFGSQTKSYIDEYDNSVLYNDSVVVEILEQFRKSNSTVKSMVYLSDHGEEILLNKGHNSSDLTFNMVRIPFLVWTNDEYKQRYPSKLSAIKAGVNKTFTNDLLDQFILGLSNVQTRHYEEKFDVANENYSIAESQQYTLHGEVKIADERNTRYFAKKNTEWLKKNNLLEKYIPHRVNTKGVYYEVLDNGLEGIELDVVIKNDSVGNTYFEIGHKEEEYMSGNNLGKVLSWKQESELKKVWLDFKNLNDTNLQDATLRLNELNKQYGLKERAIIESGMTKAGFNQLAELGYHSSYYLPDYLLKNLKEKDKVTTAQRIARQIIIQKVSAVSFDVKYYDFVETYLRDLLKEDVVYHIWDDELDLGSPYFIERLTRSVYFENRRIKTVLVEMSSPFSL